MPDSRQPTLIQSLQRGLTLIDAISGHGPMSARSLSELSGLALPTTYHLIRTLVHENYLLRLGDGRYGFGPQLLSVARLQARARGVHAIRNELARLADEAQANVVLAELRGERVIAVNTMQHVQAPRVACWEGMSLPAHATAVGKSILSQMSVADLSDFLAGNELVPFTTRTVLVGSKLFGELADTSLVRSEQEFMYGVTCVAAPVGGSGPPAALGVTYSSDRSSRRRIRADNLLAQAAVRVTAAISASALA